MIGVGSMRGMNQGRLAALSALAVAMALFLGWQSGEMIVPPDPPPARSHWSLPTRTESDPAKDLALLLERKPWTNSLLGANPLDKQGAAAKQVTQAPPWRLAGVVERPDGNFVLIAIGRPTTGFEYRSVGQTLPDGSTLIEMTSETATTQAASGDKTVHVLFRGEVPPAAPAPPRPPAPAAAAPSPAAPAVAPPPGPALPQPDRRTQKAAPQVRHAAHTHGAGTQSSQGQAPQIGRISK